MNAKIFSAVQRAPRRGLLLCGLLAGALGVDAQNPSVNPTRPTITNSPDLGPARRFEYNGGAALGRFRQSAPMLLKYTISPRWEIRLATEPYARYRATGDGGYGNSTLWVQTLLSRPDSTDAHWALGAGLNAPTGGDSMASRFWSLDLSLAAGKTSGPWHWDANLNGGAGADSGGGRPVKFGSSVILYRAAGAWSPFVEAALNFSRLNGATMRDHRLRAGAIWKSNPNWALDASLETGGEYPRDLILHFGISVLVGS